MFRVLIVGSIFLIAGCSTYDVTRLSADAAASLVVAMIDEAISLEDKVVPIGDPDRADDDDFVHLFWDADVSRCIPVEKRDRSLDQFFDSIEEGRDYVILPTGERYPVNRGESADRYAGQTPEEECIDRHSD